MKPNHLKKMLKEGKYACGSWVSMCSPIGAEVMGLAGFDWLLIDMEHGAGDYQTLLGQIQGLAASGGDATPIVRVQENDPVVIKRVLDIGAYGVMVPGNKTVADAEQAVAAIKYPPEGIRGIAGNRVAKWGLDKDYVKQSNDEMMLFLQIETGEAIENIEAILDVPGIDVAFLGPNDLSADMGYTGQWDHPEVVAAIKKLEDAANKRNIPLGTISRNWDAAKVLLDKNYKVVSIMSDVAHMLSSSQSAIASFRAHPNVAGK